MIPQSQLDLDLTLAKQERLLQLSGLDEFRMQSLLHIEVIQLQRKIWHDKDIRESTFKEGDSSLLYDSKFKDFKEKLMKIWSGPYLVDKCHENGFVQIRDIYEGYVPLIVSGHKLKLYKKPLSKEELFISFSKELNVIGRLVALSPPKL